MTWASRCPLSSSWGHCPLRGPRQAGPSGHMKPANLDLNAFQEADLAAPELQLKAWQSRRHHMAERRTQGISKAAWPPASGSPDAMQDTPERGKRIGVCKQCLKKKIAVQIQRLLTQVFTGGIIFPGLLSPKLLCVARHTCSDFPKRGRSEGDVAGPDRLYHTGGQRSALGQASVQLP